MNENPNYQFNNRVIKKVKLDKLRLVVSKNMISGKIFVEFIAKRGRLKIQRHFNNDPVGLKSAETFQDSIKSLEDMYKYFGLPKKEKIPNVTGKYRKKDYRIKTDYRGRPVRRKPSNNGRQAGPTEPGKGRN